MKWTKVLCMLILSFAFLLSREAPVEAILDLPPPPILDLPPPCIISNPAGTFKIARPIITTISPSVIPVLNLRPITVTGQFYVSQVYIKVSAGLYNSRLGPFPVKKGGTHGLLVFPDSVTFDLPSDIYSGVFGLQVEREQYCASQEPITLTITAPKPGPEWFVVTLKSIEVRHDLLDTGTNALGYRNEVLPAQARFVMGGESKEAPIQNRLESQYPAGPYLGLYNQFGGVPLKIYSDVPMFWDLTTNLGSEFVLTLAGYENHKVKQLLPDWADKGLEAVGAGVGCYIGGFSGCSTGAEIAGKVTDFLKQEVKGANPYGSLGVVCRKDGNYCIGTTPNHLDLCSTEAHPQCTVRDYTLPMESWDPNLKVKVEYRKIEAPRLKDIRVKLRDLRLFHGAAHNDDDWKKGGEDIWIRYRVAPLNLVEFQLNTARSLPEGAPDNTFSMCTASEQKWGCGYSSWLTASKTPNDFPNGGLLFPKSAGETNLIRDEHGVPALYVEIAVWESDGGTSQHLVGTYSQLFWLSDLLKDRAQYKATLNADIQSVYTYGCSGVSACAYTTEQTQGWINYDLEVTRASE